MSRANRCPSASATPARRAGAGTKGLRSAGTRTLRSTRGAAHGRLDDGELEGWADGLDASASGCPVTVTCDGDSFEEWGAICVPGEPLHVVATCNADYTEVARVAAWIGEVAGLDGDPIVTDAADWSKHLGPKAVA